MAIVANSPSASLVSDPNLPPEATRIGLSVTSQVNLENIIVLLVDDQVIVSEVIRRSLASEPDIEFHYCSDPTQAIQMALALKPSVILQDLVMPEIDGLMLLRWFRMNPATSQVPMVVLSNKEDAMMKAEAFTHGANDYLIKLPDPIELVARIRYHAQAYQNIQALSLATAIAQAKTKDLEIALEQLQATQAQLIQTEKMSGLGQMVAGIAHEINNPVNFIQGNIKHIQEYFDDLFGIIDIYQNSPVQVIPEHQETLDAIDLGYVRQDSHQAMSSMRKGVDRISMIVKSLRNFARLDQAEQKEVDLHEGLDSTLLLLQHRIGSVIGVECQYGPLPLVQCYPAQLNQVFMHVLNNAIDALKEDGDNRDRQIVVKTQVLEGDRVQIQIQDNGPGIPLEIQEKIFDPFFTTKPVDEGKGLGLSVSYRIIQEHLGQINVVSSSDQGACFIIELPVQQVGFR
jgi:two-component system, NtrC family, sensor kinase